MLDFIAQILNSIAEFISAVGGWIFDFLNDIVQLVKVIGVAVASVPLYIGWLPTAVISLFSIVLTVIVLYKFLGRD